MRYNYTLAILATIGLTPLFGLENFQKVIEQARETGDIPVFTGLSTLNSHERTTLEGMLGQFLAEPECRAKRGRIFFLSDDEWKAFTPDALARVRQTLINHRKYTQVKADLHVEYLATGKLHAEKEKESVRLFDIVAAQEEPYRGLLTDDALTRTEPYSQDELVALQAQWDAQGASEVKKQHALVLLEVSRLHNCLQILKKKIEDCR